MRVISQEVLDALASEEYRPAVLIKIDTETDILRYTTWDQPIFWNACYWYNPRGFRVNAIKYGSSSIVDNVTVKLDDVNRELYKSLAEPYGQTPICTVRIAVLDQYGEVLGSATLFVGDVTEWFYTTGQLSLKVSSVFSQWATVTTSTFSGSCRWKVFKGVECGYLGTELDCDRTYSQCTSYSNTINFGGFRWVQSLDDKVGPINKEFKYRNVT